MTRRRANAGRTGGGGTGSSSGDHLDQLLRDQTGQGDNDTNDQDGSAGDDEPDDDADHDGDGDIDGTGDDDGEPAGDQDGDQDTAGSRPATIADVERAAQRIADRTVNAVLRRLNQPPRDRDQQDSDRDRNRDRGRSDRDSDRDDTRGTIAREDTREARMAYREYFGDQHKTIDSSEREIANGLAGSLITAQLAEHGDPDRAGRHAADTVTAQLKAFRRAVERATVAALRSRGALKDPSSSGGGSQPAGVAVTPTALADKRASAKSRAERFNADLGYTSTTGQQTG